MDVKALRKKIIIKVVLYVVILGGVAAICVYLQGEKDALHEKYDWLQNDISSLERKIEGLSKKALEFSDAVKTWDTLDEDTKKLQGLRISKAQDLLDKYKRKFYLSDMEVSFSKPEELTSVYVSDTVAVISSEVSLSFKAITDESILEFISVIMKEFPGYIQMTSFSITRSGEIDKDTLLKIAAGETPGLVEAKLKFNWMDFKYKGPVTPKEGEEAEVAE